MIDLPLVATLLRNGTSPYALLWRLGVTGPGLPKDRAGAVWATDGPADADRGRAGRLGLAGGGDGGTDAVGIDSQGRGQLGHRRPERADGTAAPQDAQGSGGQTSPGSELLQRLGWGQDVQQVIQSFGSASCHAQQGSAPFRTFPEWPLDSVPEFSDSGSVKQESRPALTSQGGRRSGPGPEPERNQPMTQPTLLTRVPSTIPAPLVQRGDLVRISGGLACIAALHFSGGGPGYSAEPELDEVSEAWIADRSEWDATFAEEPTPAAIARHLDEAIEEVAQEAIEALEDDRLSARIDAYEARRFS